MKMLLKGIHTQHYRAASGYAAHRKSWLRDGLALGVVGIVEHGGVTPDSYRRLRDESQAAGYQSGVAVGPGDFGTEANAAAYARVVAAIAKHADYLVVDLEGKHEDDAQDPAKVSAFYRELRERLGPDAIIIDQPPARPIPRHHGSPVWRLVAQWTTLRAPMLYLNNLRTDLGREAYSRIMPDYLRDWNEWVPANTPQGITADPWIPTWQGYHWVDWTLVDALLRFPTCLMWCENHQCTIDRERSQGPYPTEQTRAGMRIVRRLAELGFTGPDAVKQFQASPHGVAAGLKVDGRCGPKTRTAIEF